MYGSSIDIKESLTNFGYSTLQMTLILTNLLILPPRLPFLIHTRRLGIEGGMIASTLYHLLRQRIVHLPITNLFSKSRIRY